ncbi:MAG: hypothetical protein IJU90_02780 [Bacteroidales bacterium]|nr:hypothetical protein [Bacteroidales bacterium]
MKDFVKRLLLRHRRRNNTAVHMRYYRQVVELSLRLGAPAEGEKEWMERWLTFDSHLSPLSYRIYSRFCGCSPDIVPLEICTNFIEPVLSPAIYSQTYDDKNLLGRILPPEAQAVTYLRCIRGHFYDNEYNPVENPDEVISSLVKDVDTLIVKPAKLNSGIGVELFRRKGSKFENGKNEYLCSFFLAKYGNDCQVQQYIRQHPAIARFNPDSVNTIRSATYRDCRGKIHYLGGVLRIGAPGQHVDNSHFGGICVGIESDGTLRDHFFNIHLRKFSEYNGIDLAKEKIAIENYEQIKQFSTDMAARFLHHDLLAFDIAIGCDGRPICVEVNTHGFSAWIMQAGVGPLFGDMTDEVLARVERQKTEIGLMMVQTIDDHNPFLIF